MRGDTCTVDLQKVLQCHKHLFPCNEPIAIFEMRPARA